MIQHIPDQLRANLGVAKAVPRKGGQVNGARFAERAKSEALVPVSAARKQDSTPALPWSGLQECRDIVAKPDD
jgi:hypothetical protein